MEEESVRVVRCGGSELNFRRPVFSADSKYEGTAHESRFGITKLKYSAFTCVPQQEKACCQTLFWSSADKPKLDSIYEIKMWYIFCVSGDFVKVYSTATEECVHILHGHRNLVTGIQLNPNNHLQLYSCSLDGTIKLWDYIDGILIKTFIVGHKLHALFTLTHAEDSVFVTINKEKPDRSIFTGLMIDPRTKALVLNGKPGHLQFYSLQSDKQLYNLDIIQQEYINDYGLTQIELTKAAFGCFGNWLATVEQRQEKETELELQMKLWLYNKKTQGFVLNTKINMPHEDHITALCFCNAERSENPTLVTASKDGHFKLDIIQQEYINDYGLTQIELTKAAFGCFGNWLATVEQRQEKETELELQMKLWLYNKKTQGFVLNTKINMPHEDHITALCFCNAERSENPTLVTASKDGHFKVWILTDDSDIYMEWSAKLNIRVMEPDPKSENIAAVSKSSVGSDLFVFKPSEPRPLYIQKNISREEVQWGVFVPRDVPESFTSEAYQWLNRSQFYFLTKSQSLLTFSTKSPEEKLTPSSKQLIAEESLPATPFYYILGKHRQEQDGKLNETSENQLVQLPLTENIPAINEFLHTPAHVLPSASFLCSMFINSLLLSEETKSPEEIPDDVEMEEEKESDDSDEENAFTEKTQETNSTDLGEDIRHQLSKSEEKELRKFRKVDYSWIAAL
ncbi:WD repeat-containing protein 75 [Tupaia chinensis]|uniref:WD repeat-containing protein 75 n=1 Tax=Tupaia chinensis TaxID=246437 RepID=L9KUL1_TUPCH|nr:WD repeat-containing protein 75 [Tupaia chinensis]